MRCKAFLILALAALAAIFLSAGPGHAFFGFGGKHEALQLKNGAAAVPVSALADGKAHFYSAEVNGKAVRFFLVKDPAGGVRAAFDACDVCWKERKGYSQDGSSMVCNNCGRAFPIARIGMVQGGCNPAPLVFSADSKSVTLQAADLAAGLGYFAG